MQKHIEPDLEDFEAIEREYGPLSLECSDKEEAERYRLAVAQKLIRLYEKEKSLT